MVLIGEVGIGKTRLVAELTAAATQRGGRALIGRCYETERILPFAPWVDALRTGQVLEERELLDTLEPGWRPSSAGCCRSSRGTADAGLGAIGRGGNARHLFEAIGELLARMARRHLLVVILEDLHWADEMSVRLLAFLGRRLHAVPCWCWARPGGGARRQRAPPPDPGRARRERPARADLRGTAFPSRHHCPRSSPCPPGSPTP